MLYMPVYSVRLSESEKQRWQRLAYERGMTIVGMLRLAVDEFEHSRSGRVLADTVAERVVAELQPLLDGVAIQSVPITIFDRSCTDADLHRPGQRCASCGGSAYATR